MHASIIDMTLRLPVDEVLFDELRTDFLPKAARHSGFGGFQYVVAEHGRAVGILWYERPEDLDGITRLVGTWFQDHLAPRLAGPETVVRGRDSGSTWPPPAALAITDDASPFALRSTRNRLRRAVRRGAA